ncbi:MAG: HEAT repeat domain-containing protein [Planctomycetaceae bacterium]
MRLAHLGTLCLLGCLLAPACRSGLSQERSPPEPAANIEKSRYAGRTQDEWSELFRTLTLSSKAAAEEVPQLVQVLLNDDAPPALRKLAVSMLGRIGEPVRPHVPELLTLLDQTNTEFAAPTEWGLKCISLLGPVAAEATPRLAEVLQDSARTHRERLLAIEGLGMIGPAHPRTLGLLVAELERRSAPASTAESESATRPANQPSESLAVAASDAAATASELRQSHQRNELRVATVDMLALFGATAAPAVPQLLKALRSDHEPLRRSAAFALGQVGGTLGMQGLVEALLFDDSPAVQDAAGHALAKLGTPAIPRLTQLLDDREPGVRLRAVRALGQIGKLAIVAAEPLRTRLDDDSNAVRIAAAEAIWLITGDANAARQLAMTFLDSDDRDTRRDAFLLLVLIGRSPAGAEVVAELQRLTSSDNPRLRQAAVIGLREIARP